MSTIRDAMGPTIIAAAGDDGAMRAMLDDVYGAKPAHVYAEWPHRTCATCANVKRHAGPVSRTHPTYCAGDLAVPGLGDFLSTIPDEVGDLYDLTDAPTPCPAWAPEWERVARRLLAERGGAK